MIVVTTPTGAIGSQVLAKLVNHGDSVRVIVRDAVRIPEHIREQIEVVEGSHGDLEIVNKAFQGADTVFWLVPPDARATDVNEAYAGFTRPACEAIKAQGIKHVVGVSALGRGWPKHTGLVSASLAMDDLIASTGVNYRALTMPSFMENLVNQAGALKSQGMFFSPLVADRKFPSCATVDIADAAVKLLLDPSWSGQGSLAVLGPEDLSFNDMAAIMSDVFGRTIGFKQIPMEAFKGRLAGFGMSDAMVQAYVDMMTAKNEGLDNIEVRTPENTTPTHFRQWCEETLKPAVIG